MILQSMLLKELNQINKELNNKNASNQFQNIHFI